MRCILEVLYYWVSHYRGWTIDSVWQRWKSVTLGLEMIIHKRYETQAHCWWYVLWVYMRKPTLKTLRIMLWCTFYSNPHYITLEVDVVSHNISIGWKMICLWETSNKMGIRTLDWWYILSHIEYYHFPKLSLVDAVVFKWNFHEFWGCWEIDGKTIPCSKDSILL